MRRSLSETVMWNSRNFWLVPSALASLGGMALWGLAAYYFWRYFNEQTNPSRNELSGGGFIVLGSSLPFWVAAVAFAVPARELLPRLGALHARDSLRARRDWLCCRVGLRVLQSHVRLTPAS